MERTAYGRISSKDFFKSIGFADNINEIEKDYLDTIEFDDTFYDIANQLRENYHLVLLSNDVSEWSKLYFLIVEMYHIVELI